MPSQSLPRAWRSLPKPLSVKAFANSLPAQPPSLFVGFIRAKLRLYSRSPPLNSDSSGMEKAPSFHEIFMSHLSQKPSFSEGKASYFDPTLLEASIPRHRILHFQNPLGAEYYQSQRASKTQKKPDENIVLEETLTQNKRARAEHPLPKKESKITMRHLNTPELLAAASIVTGYLGDSGFLPRTESELKKAYRHMLLKTHPDHGGDPKEFTQTLEAFRMILNVAQSLNSQPPN